MKGDIVSALYLNEKDGEGVYVQGVDSNGSKPMAWVTAKSFSQHDLDKLAGLGWKVVCGQAQKRKVVLCIQQKESD